MCLFLERTVLEKRRKLHLLILIWFFSSSIELYQITQARQRVIWMLKLLIAVNRFIVFALCRCSERFCVPSVSTIRTFCGWQKVSSAHRSLFAVLGVPECIWEQGLWSSLFGWKQQQGFQNWRSRLNFSELELILEAFCVSCWKYLQYRLEWGWWSRLCSPEWEQHRAFAPAAWSGAQTDPRVPPAPFHCTEII